MPGKRGPTGTQQPSKSGKVRVMVSLSEANYRALLRMSAANMRTLSGHVEFLIAKEESNAVRPEEDTKGSPG